MFKEIVTQNRSYRRFDEAVSIDQNQLLEWINLARLSPSSRNQQALKFMAVTDRSQGLALFEHLAWAGYLKDWAGPAQGERPVAYIVILGDTQLGKQFEIDLGIAAQTILLGSVEAGFGGCMIGSIRREQVRELFVIPDHLEILLVIALGKPAEKVIIEELCDGNIRYWRDGDGVHHVPKRNLDDVSLPH